MAIWISGKFVLWFLGMWILKPLFTTAFLLNMAKCYDGMTMALYSTLDSQWHSYHMFFLQDSSKKQ